ncbi:MAG: hypothetical protein JOY80_04535, partial [Candidatus Dormibacteraeota bacterium]|nr:hypothetical protein [Candidatus Dormibacteraeota bacterium]
VATPLTYAIVTALKRLEGVDTFDRDTNFSPLPVAPLMARLRGATR